MLTRGKGFKPVKMMRRLLGISSFMHAVDPVTSGRYPRELVLGSPERGLAHTIVHRAPGTGRDSEIGSCLIVSQSRKAKGLLCLAFCYLLLLYSLGTGCLIYWVVPLLPVMRFSQTALLTLFSGIPTTFHKSPIN